MKLLKFSNNWKHFFASEKEHLLKALKGQEITNIEHIGATSVVMCETAGTIDLLLTIPNGIDFVTIKNILVRKGYKFIENKSDYLNIMYFVRRNAKGCIVATLRVVEHGSKMHRSIIAFKYWLQEKRLHVNKYNDFRRALIEKVGDDISLYQSTKNNYIESILNDFCVVK